MAVKVAMRAGRGRGGSAGRKGRGRGGGKMAKAAHGKGSIKLKGNNSSVVKASIKAKGVKFLRKSMKAMRIGHNKDSIYNT